MQPEHAALDVPATEQTVPPGRQARAEQNTSGTTPYIELLIKSVLEHKLGRLLKLLSLGRRCLYTRSPRLEAGCMNVGETLREQNDHMISFVTISVYEFGQTASFTITQRFSESLLC